MTQVGHVGNGRRTSLGNVARGIRCRLLQGGKDALVGSGSKYMTSLPLQSLPRLS